MNPDLLAEEIEACKNRGKLPKAVVPTDLYGQCCDYKRILEICGEYGVPVVADAAEALGAFYQKSEVGSQKSRRQKSEIRSQKSDETIAENEMRKPDLRPLTSDLWNHAGVGAKAAVYSFNGNKIITTSGGGMLASDDKGLIEHARFLSQQAREDLPHYEHVEIGYNYRMSNILAAIGRGQLRVLDERVKRKREIFDYYQNALGDLPGIEFMPEAEYGRCNRWLTVILITPEEFGADRETVRLALDAEDIEARPVWKPMHAQPVFNPQITQITRINGRKKAQNTQNKNTYKARPGEIRFAVVNELHRVKVVGELPEVRGPRSGVGKRQKSEIRDQKSEEKHNIQQVSLGVR